MAKITLNDVGNLIDATTAKTTINNNSTVIETAFDNTLSRDGTSPNQMEANFDMNSNRILNLPVPVSEAEPVRLKELNDFSTGGPIPTGGTTRQSLIKISDTNLDYDWANLVKSDVGLENVDNTSDATKNAATATLTNKTIDTSDNTIVIDLSTDATGNLSVANLDSGTSASGTTFWRGDGVWAAPAGSGNVNGPISSTDNALVRFDGTTGDTIQNSEITVSDSSGTLSRTAGISIQGTNTNDSASAGYVGEYISSSVASGSAITLVNVTYTNITSISLTAGDWDVSSNITFVGGGSVSTLSQCVNSMSTTSATGDFTPGRSVLLFVGGASGVDIGSSYQGNLCGPARFSLSATTTVYLVARVTFAGNAVKAYGIISARRVR